MRFSRNFFTIALALFVLSACVSRPPALLVPIASVPDKAKTVSMLVISTRAASETEHEIYSGERSAEISGQVIDISIPPEHVTGQIEWPDSKKPDPSKEFTVRRIEATTPEQSWSWFEEQKTDGHAFIFVHGYNVRFADAIYRLAQLSHDSEMNAAPVLFTWPSRGKLFSYLYDRESATYSRDALELIIEEAVKSDKVSNITILAHSMGSWVTMEALRQMRIRMGAVPPKIRNVILAAPDLDIDVFKQQFGSLGDERPYFTFLVSADDRALLLSRILSGRVQRLGAIDPSEEPYRSDLEAMGGVTILNLTQLESGDRVNHAKYAQSPEVVRLLSARLSQGQSLGDQDASFTDRAKAVVINLVR